MGDRIHVETPAELFEQWVHRALDRHGLESSDDSAFYLVHLLDRFVRPQGPYRDVAHRPDYPLGESLLLAIQSQRAERFVLLRFTGDMALFLSGFFARSLDRRRVAPEYYQAVGEAAYGRAADCCAPRRNAPLFAELAEHFEEFAEILREVSDQCMPNQPPDLLRVYERWLERGQARDARTLARHGIAVSGSTGGPGGLGGPEKTGGWVN